MLDWRPTSRPPAAREPSPLAISSGPFIPRSASWRPKPCNVRRCSSVVSADIASRGSATSTCPGSTTCATPTWWPRSTTSSACRCFACSTNRAGHEVLTRDLPSEWVAQLPLLGISCICNLVAAIKTAKYYDMDRRDVIFTCLTDSAELYQSRLEELTAERGTVHVSSKPWRIGPATWTASQIDYLRELNYQDRKALHNFKYFTWVEQQQRSAEELARAVGAGILAAHVRSLASEWDRQIEEFNERTGVLSQL